METTLAHLDLRARVGQLVMVWMSGGYASATNPERARIERLVRERGIGGIVISIGTPLDYAARLDRLQGLARVPLLVAADFEAGAGFRLGPLYALPSLLAMSGATAFPPAMAFGAVGDEGTVFEAARITAIEARALGVHLNFAPVLDVNNNPANPIINTRSFGEDPARVDALGRAYIRGLHAGGLLATAKHFPGHGDTGVDSHLELPVIPGDRARLDGLELVPFRGAIEEGVDAIMTAHVAVPGILGGDAPPATLSPYFLTRLLRDDLDFDGLVFTDALDMGAIVRAYGPDEASVRALEAGADVLLMPTDPDRAIEAVVAAVREGRIDAARIEASVRRLLTLKARAGLAREPRIDPGRVAEVVGIAAHTAHADTVARRALTLVRDFGALVPVDTARAGRVLAVTFARAPDLAAGRVFDRRLAESLTVESARVDFGTPPARFDSLALRADSADLVVVSAYVPPRSAAGSVDVPPALGDFLNAAEATGTPVAVISFGSPYVLASLPEPSTYLLAWGGGEASQRAAADALLGRAPISGRLPISLPPGHALGEGLERRPEAGAAPEARAPRERNEAGRAGPAARTPSRHAWDGEAPAPEVGMDSARLARVDRILRTAIADGVTPGAALAVGRHGKLARLRAYGRLDWAADAAAVTDSTLYDLASLTKVVGTTTAAMRLVEEGRLRLDAPVGDYLPEWSRGWKAQVTMRHLLLHRGGVPAFRPYWRELEGAAAYRQAFARLEPEYPPGSRTVYSDIGFMTLAFVVESVAGRPLDAYLDEILFGPLGLRETMFNPPPALRPRVAPSEVDTVFRHRHVRGEVHDENAFAAGGVAGHAGLFSSARDLARFADWMLAAARAAAPAGAPSGGVPGAAGSARDPALARPSPATVREFTRRADRGSSRALGWDTPSGRSSAGRFFSTDAFGHTGFTGTSIWIDPELDLFVVLLTNRVNPTRDNQRHIGLRRAVHDAVATAIVDRTVEPRP